MLKKHRASMPYKRFSPAAYAFLFTDFDSFSEDFFNNTTCRFTYRRGVLGLYLKRPSECLCCVED
jgi:hypothetical protein